MRKAAIIHFHSLLSLATMHYVPIASSSKLASTFSPLPRFSSARYSTLRPSLRTKLTNIAFYAVALSAVITVSLGMSGVGPAKVLPCPARSSSAVALDRTKDWPTEPSHKPTKQRKWLSDPSPSTSLSGSTKQNWFKDWLT